MDAPPLTRPEPLRPADRPRSWLAHRPAGAIAAVLGLATFALVAVSHTTMWSIPDPWFGVPGLAGTAIAAVASIARHERARSLWLIGLAFAAGALALNWFLGVAIAVLILALIVQAM